MKKFAKILGFLGFFVTVATVQIGTAWAAGAVRCEAGYYLPAGSDECQECPGTVSVSGTNVGVYCLGSGEQEWFPGESAQGLRYCNDDKACGDSSNWEYTRVGAESEADCNGGPMNGCSCHHPNDFCPDGATCLYNENFTVSGTNFCGTCVIDKENTNTWCPLTCPKSCNNGTCTCPGDDCTGYEEVHNLPGVHYCGTAANACDVTHLIQGENTSNAQIVEANPLNYQCSAYDECKVECSHEGNPTCDYSGAICEWDLNTPAKTGYQQGDDCIDPQTNQPIEPFDCNIIITGCSNSCQYWDANLKQCVTYTTDVTYKCNGTTQQGPTVTCGTDYFVNRNPNAINGNYVINLEASGCVPAGQVFSNWKLSIDNSSHSNDDRFPWNYTDATATFEAQWEEDKLYIHYHRYDGDWVQANPPFEDKEAFTISDLQPNGLTKYWTLTRDNSTFRGWCDDLYYSHLSDATWLNSHCQGPSSYTIPNTVNTDVHLYAWWECTGAYTLNSSYQCEGNKIDVKYTCHAPENSSYNDTSYTYNNAATYGQEYKPVKSVEEVTTASNSTACQFAGYEIDPQLGNSYQWSLKNWNYSTGGKYSPGGTMAANDWQHISPTPETEIEFELEPNVWKAKKYSVQYRCGTIEGTPVPGNATSDEVSYNGNYTVANSSVYEQPFLDNCDETFNGNVSGYTVQNWTLRCTVNNTPNTIVYIISGQDYVNTGHDIEHWLYDYNDCYFTANWAQTDFVIHLESNISDGNNNSINSSPTDLYTRWRDGVYVDPDMAPEHTMNPSSPNQNSVTTPKKFVTVTFDGDDGTFEWGDNPQATTGTDDRIELSFKGFFEDDDPQHEGEQYKYIYDNGYITQRGWDTGISYQDDEEWHAHWGNGSVPLPWPVTPQTGYTFVGWNCNDTLYSAAQSITISGDTTCTAEFKPACYEVTFDDTTHGAPNVTVANNPARYVKYGADTLLDRWYIDSDCLIPWYDGENMPSVNRPTKENATFNGYYDEGISPEVQVFGSNGILTLSGQDWTTDDNVVLYAQYVCVSPYHPMPDGSCGSCDSNEYWNPNANNGAGACESCRTVTGGNFPYSTPPFNWSVDQCYNYCGEAPNTNEQSCETDTSVVDLYDDCTFEKIRVDGEESSTKQIEFKGNADNNVTACDGTVRYCAYGFAGCDTPNMKPMSVQVDFKKTNNDIIGTRYIFGSRSGGGNIDVNPSTAKIWSQIVGPGQKDVVESHPTFGTYYYTHIIYPTYLAPETAPSTGYEFTGYYYPATDGDQYVDSDLALGATNASGVLNSQEGNSNTTRNLYANYELYDMILSYSCNCPSGVNCGNAPESRTVQYNVDYIPAINTCVYTGHTFEGWMTSSSNVIVPDLPNGEFSPRPWPYTESQLFKAKWSGVQTPSINYEKIPVDDVNTGGPTDNGNTYVPADDGTPTQFTCGSGITPITGHPYLLDPNGTQIGEVTEWCDNEGLTNNCAATRNLSNSDCSEKTVYAKWECTDPRYHLNGNKDDCVACPDHTFWNGSDCIAETECPDGYTNAHTPYNWSINQCYRFCETKTCEYANDIQFAIGTANFLNPSNNPGSKQIAFYGNEIPGDPNRFDVCNDDSIKYCPRVLIGSGLGSSPLKPRESLVTFMKNDSSSPAGTRYIVGNRSSANYDMDMFTDATKIWSHVVGLGQQGQSTNSSDPHIYTFIIYPTDTAPNPGDTGALFMGYYDAQNGGVQRVAAALGLDSSNSTSNNAIAFPQSPLSENQIGDRILYPQYCANGETWNGQSCTGNDYTVKYVCGDHGTAPGEMTNTATFGQPYTVAILDGGALAECTANTGYVLKTNNSGNPLWYFNGDSSADHYTNEVINPWNFTIQSPTFTAQYDCARGYTWNPEHTACVSISDIACPAELSENSHASLVGDPSINVNGECVYTIQCDLCQTSGVYGCYTHDPISNGQFTITDDQYDADALDGVSCTPADFCVTLDNNSGNGGIGTLCETYGEGWHKSGSEGFIDSLDSSDLPTWVDNSQVFAGYWTLQNDGNMEINSEGLIVANNTILEDNNQTWYAHWGDGTGYTVTFKCDVDPQWIETLTVYPTQDIDVPQTQCLRTGYTFTNWVDTPHNVTIPATNQTFNWTGEFNSVLTPDWTANTYRVTYKCNEDDTGVTDPTAAEFDHDYYVQPHNDNIVRCAEPEGKVFVKWSLNTTPDATLIAEDQNITWQYDISNPTFTAQWTDGCHKVSLDNRVLSFGGIDPTGYTSPYVMFYIHDGNWYSDNECRNSISPYINALPTKTNATFLGYDIDQTPGNSLQTPVFYANIQSGVLVGAYLNPEYNTWTITGDTTLYAKYDCDDDYTLDGTTCVLDSSNFHTITLDENAAEFYGAASNPNVLYTIEGTAQAYTDEEHNDPFSSLNENGFPRKYAKVTFHYCNGTNNSCDNPLTQNEIKDADFIFNGFYATTPANGQRYINSEGDMLPAGNNAAAAATTDTRWYADWNGYGTLEVSRWPVPNQSQTPAGYTFGGWWTSPNCGDIQVISSYQFTTPDTDLYACWSQTVKYVCGDHGTASSEMTNTATFGQSYTVAILYGGALAECTANTGYVLKTNDSDKPLWKFNGDDPEYSTGQVINLWNFTIQSPTFTAQYGCDTGYTWQDGECKPGINLCNAAFPLNTEPHANIIATEYVSDQCIYTIQCAPCGDGTNGCYEHDGDQSFDITLDPSILVLPDTSFCTPKEYSISYDDTQRTLHFNVDTGACNPTSYLYGNTTDIDCRLDAPNDSHAVFKGWCTGTNTSTRCAETQSISATDYGDKTYYAWWDCDQNYHQNGLTCDPDGNLPLIYKPNGGQPNEDYTVLLSYGQEFSTEGAIYNKTGNILARWDVAAGGANTFNSHFDDTTNTYYAELGENYSNGYLDTTTTLNAHWEACQCDIGTGVASCNANVVTENACTPEVTCQTGYTNPHIECTGTYNTICRVTCDAEGQYEIILSKNFTVGQNGPHGEYSNQLYTIHDTGVYRDYEREDEMTETTNPLTSLPNKYYTVTFNHCDRDNDTYCSNPVTTSEIENAYFTLLGFYANYDSEDPGYRYIKQTNNQWFITNQGIAAGKNYDGVPADYTWYAQWNGNSGTLMWNDFPSDPTREGYIFDGWWTQPGETGTRIETDYIAYNDTTLYAHWTVNSCDDEYILVSNSCVTPQDCKPICSVNCTYPGQSNGVPSNSAACPNGTNYSNLVVSCNYDTTSNSQGGYYEPTESITKCRKTENCDLITASTCRYTPNCTTGYIWNNDANDCIPDSNQTYTIKFICEEGGNPIVDPQTVHYGENITVPSNSACTNNPGYSYSRWKATTTGNHPTTLNAQSSTYQYPWEQTHGETFIADWNDGNVYHAHLNPYSYGQSDQSGTFGDAGVEDLWERYGDNWYENYDNGNLTDVISYLNAEQLPTRTGGYSFAGYKTRGGDPRLNYADNRWNLMSPTTITGYEEWYAQWTQCTPGQYYLNGCVDCPLSHPNSDPTTATSMSDCYYFCSRCEANGCPTFGGAVCAYADPNSLNLNNGGVYYGTNTCVLLPGNTTPPCPYTVISCADGYLVNGTQTACEPMTFNVQYSCGDHGAFLSYNNYNTATYGTDYKVAYNIQNQEIQCSPYTGYLLSRDATHDNKPVWKLNYGNEAGYTGQVFPWQYIFPYGTNPTYTAQYICDTANGYNQTPNGTCIKCPSNQYWNGSQCADCGVGQHPNATGDGCEYDKYDVTYACGEGTGAGYTQQDGATYNSYYNVLQYSDGNINCTAPTNKRFDKWLLNTNPATPYYGGAGFYWTYTIPYPTFTAQYVDCGTGYHTSNDGTGCEANHYDVKYVCNNGTGHTYVDTNPGATYNVEYYVLMHNGAPGCTAPQNKTFNGWTLNTNPETNVNEGTYIRPWQHTMSNPTFTANWIDNNTLCPDTLDNGSHATMAVTYNASTNKCEYLVTCDSCVTSNPNTYVYGCYLNDNANTNTGQFTVYGAPNSYSVLDGVVCTPATYTAVYRCGVGTPTSPYYDTEHTITYNESYTVLDNMLQCQSDSGQFNGWAFNGEHYDVSYVFNHWRYYTIENPTFVAEYGECPSGYILVNNPSVPGECKKKCPVSCTWPGYPDTNPNAAPCPAGYPQNATCHYDTTSNPGIGYRPTEYSPLCLDPDTGGDPTAQTCALDDYDPTCPAHYHWNNVTQDCDPDIYTVALNPCGGVAGSVTKLWEKWNTAWSKDGTQFSTYVTLEGDEKPHWNDNSMVFDGYWTSCSGGNQRIDANGNVIVPANIVEGDGLTWYAHWKTNTSKYTVTFKCSISGSVIGTPQQVAVGENLTVPATTSCPGVPFNQWKGTIIEPTVSLLAGSQPTLVPWQYYSDETFIPDSNELYRVDLTADGGTFTSNEYVHLWDAVNVGWFKDAGLTPPAIPYIPRSGLPTRQGFNFNGFKDSITGETRGYFNGTDGWNLPPTTALHDDETWIALWGECSAGQYYQDGQCKNCPNDYTSDPSWAQAPTDCYKVCHDCVEPVIPNGEGITGYACDHNPQLYNGYLFYSPITPNPNSCVSETNNPIQCTGCCVTCASGYETTDCNSCVKKGFKIDLKSHRKTDLEGRLTGHDVDPDLLYIWSGIGVYWYSNYTTQIKPDGTNPVNIPDTYAVVRFNPNGEGVTFTLDNYTYSDQPGDRNVSFSFRGFYNSEDGASQYIRDNGRITNNGESTAITTDTDLIWHAQWDSNNIGTLPQPTRQGYHFDGWYDAIVEGHQVDANTPVYQSMNVYAHWSKEKYYVNLNENGGVRGPNFVDKLWELYGFGWSTEETGTFERDLVLSESERPSYVDNSKVFNGYWTSKISGNGEQRIRADGSVVDATATVLTVDNTTWYAQYVNNTGTFKITFRCGANEDPLDRYTQYVQNNGTVRVPAKSECQNTGYTFTHWNGNHNTTFIARDDEYTTTWSGVFANEDFVPNWNNGDVYHVTLLQTGATEPGDVGELYEKYGTGWGYNATGPWSNSVTLSGDDLPTKTGHDFAGFKLRGTNYTRGDFDRDTGIWTPMSNMEITGNEEWEPKWTQCKEYWYYDSNLKVCVACPEPYTNNAHPESLVDCYDGRCTRDCVKRQNECPSDPNAIEFEYSNDVYDGTNYYGERCVLDIWVQQGTQQEVIPSCECTIKTCKPGYHLVDGVCVALVKTYINLNPNNYVDDVQQGNPSTPATIYTTEDTGVYLDSDRTMPMDYNHNPLDTKPSKYALVTLDANGGSVDWGNNGTARIYFTFQGFNASSSPNYGYMQLYIVPRDNGYAYITDEGSDSGLSVGMGYTTPHTWYAQWNPQTVELPTPTRTGYTFTGWYNVDTGVRVPSSVTVNTNLNLVARWERDPGVYVTYNCDSDGGQGGNGQDFANPVYYGDPYTVLQNGDVVTCSKPANIATGTRYHEFEDWQFSGNFVNYRPGYVFEHWTFIVDNPTFNAHYKECPNGWYFDGSCKQCPSGYTSSDIDADSATKCYKTCDVQCTQPTSQCPMNEEGVLTCTYPNNTYPFGKQYSGSDDCIYDEPAPACEPFTIMCKPGYTPDYYLSTDTGTHCTKLADHEITLDPNGGTGGQEKLYTTYNTGVYLDQARTLRMRLNQNYLTDLPEKTAIATFNYCDDNGANCDGNPTTRSVSVDLGLKGYYQTATNNTRYLEPVPNIAESKLRITDGGDTAGQSYQDNTHTWYAQWSPTAIENSRWPANPANHTAQCKTYTFNNWWTDPHGGTSVDYNTEISENVTWYAHWCESCPTGTIDHGSCTAQKCKAEFKCDDGYDWNADNCSCVLSPDTRFTLTYKPNGGTPTQPRTQSLAYGETFPTLGGDTFTKSGEVLCHWDEENHASSNTFPEAVAELSTEYTYLNEENITLLAHWAPCQCTQGAAGVQGCSFSVVNNACVPTVTCMPGYIPNGTPTCAGECNTSCDASASCQQCTAGTYQDGNECKPCPSGFTSNAGATSCYGNTITIDWDENGGNPIPSDQNGSCQYCINDNSQPAWAQCNSADNNLTLAAAPTHNNNAMRFLGWKLATGSDLYSAGTSVMCTHDNVGVYSGTSTAIQAQWNECQCNYSEEDHVLWCQPTYTSGSCMCFAKCEDGYKLIDDTYTCTPSCIPETYSEGITYKPNGGTPNQNYTQSVAYNATFTTFDWSVEHYTKAHHILAGWAVESGGVGTFDGTAALNTTYTYRTDGPTSLLAKWTECANDEISFSTDNQCHQCTCDAPNCNTYATDENKCACDATCPTGYTYDGCNCSGTVCEPICNKKQSDAIYVCGDDATGTPPATETMNYGATHTVKGQASCAKLGYTFNGWNFTGTNGNYNPGATVQWNYETNQTFTGNWCENCVQPDHGECSLNAGVAGMCSYNCNCNAGYTLFGGVCTAHPVCEPDDSLTITYRPNGGVNPQTGNNRPVLQPVTYWADFTTLMGTTFTMGNHILTRWDLVGDDTSTFDKHQDPDTNQYYAKLNEYYDHYKTLGDTILDAHWEQCTCTTGNGVSSCTTSSTSENACACAGECAVRYIDGGCTCNGTTSCTQTCTECPAGYISNADQTECVICPENTYQSGNTCEQCPTGYTSPAGSTSIEDCYNNPVSYTVHYSSNNGLNQTETQPVVYGTTFTTLGGTTFTYDNHIMTRWNKISGGDYTELSYPYEYGVQEDTFLKAQWAECTCATGNGVSSCTTSSTSENACACTGECAAGYVKGECSCSGNTCTQSCTKCADNQVEVNGVCVDCSCSADGNGVVSGCGFVSNENNVCNWGTTTCDTGYNNPGDLSCDDSVHNNNCRAICSQIQSSAIYECGTGTGIPPVSELVDYGTQYIIKANAAVYGCHRENSRFAGWEFDGTQETYWPGDAVTWNYTEDRHFRAVYCNECLTGDHCTLDIPNPGECVVTCHTGYEWDANLKKCVAKTYENGITYKPNGGTPNRNYTQSVIYDAPFTTLDWSVEHYTKAHHVLTRWDVESGGVGTFDNGYADLGREYIYKTDGATSLLAKWIECGINEISLDNQCQQCRCTDNNAGVTSCETSATNNDTCSCSGECAAGYINAGCNCNGTNCTQSCTKCADNQVSVNNVCEDCVCNVNDDSGATSCGTKSVIDNMCNWGPATCRPGYAYPTIICDGSNNQLCEASCTICPAGTYQDGEVCTSCPTCQTSLPGATSVNECFTDSTCCAPDEHIEHGECTPNVRRCSIPDATNAVRIWNPAIGTYGPCTVEVDGCNSGYHVSGNVCVKDTEACTVEHGHGEHDWNGTSWGACGDVVCDPGYEPNSDYTACVECSNRRVNGDIAVSGYIYECEIAACMYQGQKYALQNGECVPICEDASDETGTKVWDERTKKCIRTCKPGYKMW